MISNTAVNVSFPTFRISFLRRFDTPTVCRVIKFLSAVYIFGVVVVSSSRSYTNCDAPRLYSATGALAFCHALGWNICELKWLWMPQQHLNTFSPQQIEPPLLSSYSCSNNQMCHEQRLSAGFVFVAMLHRVVLVKARFCATYERRCDFVGDQMWMQKRCKWNALVVETACVGNEMFAYVLLGVKKRMNDCFSFVFVVRSLGCASKGSRPVCVTSS